MYVYSHSDKYILIYYACIYLLQVTYNQVQPLRINYLASNQVVVNLALYDELFDR